MIVAELGVKVLAVRGGAHGGAEDGLDEEGVVGLEGVAVCVAEGDTEFFVRGCDVCAEGLGGEVESAVGGINVSEVCSSGKHGCSRTYRTSQTRPSVAVCFFVASSFLTRSWRFSDAVGAWYRDIWD